MRGSVGEVEVEEEEENRDELESQPWVVSSSTKSLACSAVITSM